MPFELPQLNFSYDALEPFIDAKTMEIHHTKHHQTYVTNLNKGLENADQLQNKTVVELISNLNSVPQDIRTAVRNNGGGHFNHTLFWQLLTPNYKKPQGAFLNALEATFGSLETFQQKFADCALSRFGSGWTWLIKIDQKLEILSTPNQDHPIMENEGAVTLLGLDVWEHAYYLNYQNRRVDYVKEWWNVVNWQQVEDFFGA